MDYKLYFYYYFVYNFIDEIIIFSNFIKKYLEYLEKILVLFQKLCFYLFIDKKFLNYFSVQFLNYKINKLGLLMIEEYITIIKNLEFFTNLKNLEYYLDITG
jgi:hypothetical protein